MSRLLEASVTPSCLHDVQPLHVFA
jgi:hypothetical protein